MSADLNREDGSPITLIIADDHAVVRQGLRFTVQLEPDLILVGEATNGRDAVALARRRRPRLALLDVQMPEMDGIAAAAAIRDSSPETAVVILTNYAQDHQLFAALRAGVMGYLLKDIEAEELVAALRGAARGRPQLHPAVTARLMQHTPGPEDPFARLTAREREILQALARGYSNREIAEALYLTEATVKGYVSTVLAKLGVPHRTQAALVAVRYGLVRMEELPDLAHR